MSQRARTDAPPPPNMVYERSTPDARVATIDAPALGCSIALLEVARKWRRRIESDPANIGCLGPTFVKYRSADTSYSTLVLPKKKCRSETTDVRRVALNPSEFVTAKK